MTLEEIIRFDEGSKNVVYKDSEGYWTVGVGHLLTKNQSKDVAIAELDELVGHKTYGYINDQEIQKILTKDINRTVRDISRTNLALTYTVIDEVRRAALVNMVFQLGATGVLGFKKMLEHLNNREYELAADEALDSKWAVQTPARAKRVTEVIRNGNFESYK
ncbi:sulfurtransferase [Klebsiella aerogenes]|uniref:glycoside hydrolase family protein n=1 Tax=Klebsiella aerogenes TaxID=548 RepID=UPI000C774D28|nr:glycoside hydrolase family protein [Klebsiella aerogenes]PLC39095.1 sulfurtransferase [Klebsiella aerogenes]WPR92333.1 glycoside hydrolase family protein [Klebsiella aerogenes]